MDEENLSDAELISKVLERPDYFVHVVKRYQGPLMRYVRTISHATPEEAEEILQEVFIKIYQHLNEFRPELKFQSWVYRIAHNHAINFYRHNKSELQKREFEHPWDLKNLVEEFVKEGDPQTALEDKQIQEKISRIIFLLPDPYREVASLRFLEDKDYEEISDILKKPIGTIATLVNRSKKKIRDKILKE